MCEETEKITCFREDVSGIDFDGESGRDKWFFEIKLKIREVVN